MKKILILTLLATVIISCQNNKQENKEKKVVQNVKTVVPNKTDDSLISEKLFQEFKILYDELLTFKDKTDFKKFGFSVGGPYNKWLKQVESLKANPNSKLLIKKGVFAGELEQLGMQYVSSKGKENESTIFLNQTFSNAISPIKVEKVKSVQGNSNYEKIKSEYKLFGKWYVSVTMANKSYGGYIVEIYEKNNNYISIIPDNNFQAIILIKKG